MLTATGYMLVWPNPLFLVIGTCIGLLFGVIPGLSGALAIALMIPLTFSMDIYPALCLLLSALGGSAFGGSISAILIGIPGTSVNAATVFDGHALAKQGKADLAIGASATASALGAILGIVVLITSIPFLISALLMFGPTEVFMLTFMGLTIIAVAVEGSFVACFLSGMVGMLLSFHGWVSVVGGDRFTFGSNYLWDGFPLLPVFIGLFAISGGIELLLGGASVVNAEQARRIALSHSWSSTFEGVLSIFRNFRVFIVSSIIGVLVGIVPGVGGAVSNMLAYAVAKHTSKDPDSFGQGNVAGVIASESANDAKDGGALMPTIALGIPGSEVMAILLGAFVLHGIEPGREMLIEHLDAVWVVILALLVSNVLTSVIGIVFARYLIRITVLKVSYYAPSIICIAVIGAYGVHQELIEPIIALFFGVIGFAMKRRIDAWQCD
jgi:putative tricarboxylic transport membrane protein